MEVILTADFPGLGKKDDKVNVKDGYARNYLFPKGLAVPATKGALRAHEAAQAAKKGKEDRLLTEATRNAERLKDAKIVFMARAGQGRIFGSITPAEIAARILKAHKIKVDKRKVLLSENIKDLGVHTVEIQLHPGVRVPVEIEVRAEGSL